MCLQSRPRLKISPTLHVTTPVRTRSIYWPLRRQEPLDTRTGPCPDEVGGIFIDLLSCGGRIRLGNLREHMYIKSPRAPHKGYIQPLAIFFWLDATYVGPGLRVAADYTHREYRLSESTVATPADETCTSPACQCFFMHGPGAIAKIAAEMSQSTPRGIGFKSQFTLPYLNCSPKRVNGCVTPRSESSDMYSGTGVIRVTNGADFVWEVYPDLTRAPSTCIQKQARPVKRSAPCCRPGSSRR